MENIKYETQNGNWKLKKLIFEIPCFVFAVRFREKKKTRKKTTEDPVVKMDIMDYKKSSLSWSWSCISLDGTWKKTAYHLYIFAHLFYFMSLEYSIWFLLFRHRWDALHLSIQVLRNQKYLVLTMSIKIPASVSTLCAIFNYLCLVIW